MDLSAFIEDVLDYIENHLESVLTHERLAKRFNVPKPYLQRLFSAVMGLSLKQYTLERKLNAAIYLIQSTDYTLKEIGAHLEFSTPAAFSRAFKRQYSITPSSLRKSPYLLSTVGVPSVAGHFFKSLSDAGVAEFKLLQRAPFRVSGFVASVDISRPDDMLLLNGQFSQLLDALGWAPDSSGYILYSDGLPDQTVYTALIGVEEEVTLDLPGLFVVDVPELLGIQFNYSGSLLGARDVVSSDFAQFLHIIPIDGAQHDIQMIQSFDSVEKLDQTYQLFVPIQEDEWDG